MDSKVSIHLGRYQVALHGHNNLDFTPLEFRVSCLHNAFNLAVRAMLVHNLTKKCDQLIAYAFKLFNHAKCSYAMTKKETLEMMYAFHNFFHYLLGNKFIFHVDHMVLYLVRKRQISS